MNYKIKVKEVDEETKYPLIVLSGLTGLSQKTIQELAQQGNFPLYHEGDQTVIKGQDFLNWAQSVDNCIEVEKTDYQLMAVQDEHL